MSREELDKLSGSSLFIFRIKNMFLYGPKGQYYIKEQKLMYTEKIKIEELAEEVKNLMSELTGELFKNSDINYVDETGIKYYVKLMKLANKSLDFAVQQNKILEETEAKLDKVLSHLDEMTALIERGNSDVKYIASNTKFNKN